MLKMNYNIDSEVFKEILQKAYEKVFKEEIKIRKEKEIT